MATEIRVVKFDSEMYFRADDVVAFIDETITFFDGGKITVSGCDKERYFLEGCKMSLGKLRAEIAERINTAEDKGDLMTDLLKLALGDGDG